MDAERVTVTVGGQSVDLSQDEVDLICDRLVEATLAAQRLRTRFTFGRRSGHVVIKENDQREQLASVLDAIEAERPGDHSTVLQRLHEIARTPLTLPAIEDPVERSA